MKLHTEGIAEGDMVPVQGELPPEALDVREDTIEPKEPIAVDLTAQREGNGGIVVTGRVATTVRLCCGRCLEWIDWPLEAKHFCAEYPAPVDPVIDLTPAIREDILLELPFNTACRLDADHRCPYSGRFYPPETEPPPALADDVWGELDRLKNKE